MNITEAADLAEVKVKKIKAVKVAKPVLKAANAKIYDEASGKLFEYIDDSQYTPEQLGRKRRYAKNFYQSVKIYVVKRDKAGVISPVCPPGQPGEVTPEMAGDALVDNCSAQLFSVPTSWMDVLKDFKFPIVIGILVVTIFIISFTFDDPNKKPVDYVPTSVPQKILVTPAPTGTQIPIERR